MLSSFLSIRRITKSWHNLDFSYLTVDTTGEFEPWGMPVSHSTLCHPLLGVINEYLKKAGL